MIAREASVPRSAGVARDPLLLLPLVVAAGLAIGWVGRHANVSATRVAVDLALSWCFVAAALVPVGPERWRRSRALFAVTGFAVLTGDLLWTNAPVLWTIGWLTEALWLAVIAQLVLTFPEGRPWSRSARLTIAAAYLVVLGGALATALMGADPRDLLSVSGGASSNETVTQVQTALGVAVALTFLLLVGIRLIELRGPARRAQTPLLVGACLAFPLTIVVLLKQALGQDDSTFTGLETASRAMMLLIPLGLLAGVGWSRLRRSQATNFVVELQTGGSVSLRERLARALGDPSLELAYRLDDGRFVDERGESTALPDDPQRAVTLVSVSGETVAALVHDPLLLDDPALVESVRGTAGLVLENERLAAEVRAQLAEVRASRTRLVAATDEERRRIERDLHDGAQQRLVVLCVKLGVAAGRTEPEVATTLLSAQDELEEAIAELRALARGIHPTLLREEGLDVALEGLARRAPLPVTIEGCVGGRLAPALELAAYFVATEALTNAVKHAAAASVTVDVEHAGGTFRLVVSDDGVGGALVTPAGGLSGLRDRVEALDGTLTVRTNPAGGTTVAAEMPCPS
jgi:signal transduction histidine kinase